jgi:signal transduction histidine kinase
MTPANLADSNPLQLPNTWLRRLFSQVSPMGLLTALGLALVLALGRFVDGLLVAVKDHEFLDWLAGVVKDFGGHGLMALVMVVCIGPVLALSPPSGWRRVANLVVGVAIATAIAALVRILVVGYTDGHLPWPQMLHRLFLRFFVRYGYLAALFVVAIEFYRYEMRSIAAMHGAEVDKLSLEREMSAARLQVLQAQIEPHFLFNTLANVRRLYQVDPSNGQEMLDNLMRYLEVALPRMRDDTSTLGREAALIEAFLGVQKIRMGSRLDFEIDIPAVLNALTVPPMMLLTLVENALKHGLNPLLEGGRIRVDAQICDDRLVMSVVDTGRGFGEGTSGGGTGLANIRARLSAMFGEGAKLALQANTPRGVLATISMPAIFSDDASQVAS